MENKPFVIDEDDRYSRLKLIAWWDQQKLSNARVIVVGAGALGNEVLKNLALLGIGQVDVIDFDRIENSNLSRSVLFRAHHKGQFKAEVAARQAMELNPEITVNSIVGNVLTDIGLGLVQRADAVVGCLDNREARLWVNRMCWKVDTPWIDGGIQEINGVVKVFRPPDGPCYECGMTDNDYRLIQLRYSCPLLSQSDMQRGRVPTTPTIASIIGGLQVQELLKLIHQFEPSEATAFVFNGAVNNFYQTQYPNREDCLSHETYGVTDTLDICPPDHTLEQLFQAVAGKAKIESNKIIQLVLDRDLVVSLTCEPCGYQKNVMRPMSSVNIAEANCPDCGQIMKSEMIHSLTVDSTLSDQKLSKLGIPGDDIVKVETADGWLFFQLQ